MTKEMDFKRIIEDWNLLHKDRFYLNYELLEATFFSWPENKRGLWSFDTGVVLYKIDDTAVRIHWASGDFKTLVPPVIENLKGVARKNGKRKIIFGAGMEHLFPGVPLDCGFDEWLNAMSPFNEIQSDFCGNLIELSKNKILSQSHLRRPETTREKKDLKEMIQNEFPGRWTNEFQRDEKLGFIEHYFGFYVNNVLTGYVRLYGWNPSYRAPGVYWKKEGEKLGGLGPIGVKNSQRGMGLGGQLLAASWQELCNRGLLSVRVDWTTEIQFYKKAGLREVQRYQPAFIQID